MALQVFIVALLIVGGFGVQIPKHYGAKHPAQYGSKTDEYYEEEPADYGFVYGVKDQRTGQDFSHQEAREGYSVTGEYRVLLPDGRVQIVSYVADEDGYRADVSYEGEAKPSLYKPRFPPISSKPTRPPHTPTPVNIKELRKTRVTNTTPKPKNRYTSKPYTRPKPIVTTTSKPRQAPKTLRPKTLRPKTLRPKTLRPKTLRPKTLRPNTSRAKASYLKPFDPSPYNSYPGPYGPTPFNYQPDPYSFSDIPYPSRYDDGSYSPYYPTAPAPYSPGPYPPGPFPPSPYFPPTYSLGLGNDGHSTTQAPTNLYRAVPHQATSSLYSLLIMDDEESVEGSVELSKEHQ